MVFFHVRVQPLGYFHTFLTEMVLAGVPSVLKSSGLDFVPPTFNLAMAGVLMQLKYYSDIP